MIKLLVPAKHILSFGFCVGFPTLSQGQRYFFIYFFIYLSTDRSARHVVSNWVCRREKTGFQYTVCLCFVGGHCFFQLL